MDLLTGMILGGIIDGASGDDPIGEGMLAGAIAGALLDTDYDEEDYEDEPELECFYCGHDVHPNNIQRHRGELVCSNCYKLLS